MNPTCDLGYCYYEMVRRTMHTAIVSYLLNYIKSDCVWSINQFIFTGFSQGDFHKIQKSKIKGKLFKVKLIFYSKDHMCRLKENTLFAKKCSG